MEMPMPLTVGRVRTSSTREIVILPLVFLLRFLVATMVMGTALFLVVVVVFVPLIWMALISARAT
jgi:hypothetical protein